MMTSGEILKFCHWKYKIYKLLKVVNFNAKLVTVYKIQKKEEINKPASLAISG